MHLLRENDDRIPTAEDRCTSWPWCDIYRDWGPDPIRDAHCERMSAKIAEWEAEDTAKAGTR